MPLTQALAAAVLQKALALAAARSTEPAEFMNELTAAEADDLGVGLPASPVPGYAAGRAWPRVSRVSVALCFEQSEEIGGPAFVDSAAQVSAAALANWLALRRLGAAEAGTPARSAARFAPSAPVFAASWFRVEDSDRCLARSLARSACACAVHRRAPRSRG